MLHVATGIQERVCLGGSYHGVGGVTEVWLHANRVLLLKLEWSVHLLRMTIKLLLLWVVDLAILLRDAGNVRQIILDHRDVLRDLGGAGLAASEDVVDHREEVPLDVLVLALFDLINVKFVANQLIVQI